MAADPQLIMNLLRILTPEEISQLTTTSEGNHRVPLTELVEYKANKVSSASGAKILPFKRPGSNIEEIDGIVSEEIGSSSDSPQESEIKSSAKKSKNEDSSIRAGVLVNQLLSAFLGVDFGMDIEDDDTPKEISLFIIHEKKKFEESYSKLKSKEVITLYNENAAVDIEQEKNMKDDLNKSSQFGILVNKKQY
ncbi:MAG: hypothetical protein HN509_13615 [Halobacteriovoraceae bacterium]|nr:hypothetical protein [Halobacteriovoraceae bacterium]MBT5095465.1 hypothetical protein [Halobacteriovoraceae bacterium]